MSNNKYTFWKLLDENLIEIPIIQRDYAQGRIDENKIRDKFLDVLYNKIKNVDETVNLDFVYGRIINGKLIPLDGQQRLTTLFLLHWYLATKENRFDEASKKLQKFTYETRVSSREFCKALSTNQIYLLDIGNFEKEEDKKLSKLIEDKNWFFKSWKKDPTIKSMLNMLDSIHERFKNTEDNNLFDKLVCHEDNKKAITFDFLPLNDFNLTDELYIKMNARGKPLTHFENFKSNFVELLDPKVASKLDNEWTDLFWSFKGEEPKKDGYYYIDDKFLNFFTNCIINLGLISDKLKETKDLKEIDVIDIYKEILVDDTNLNNLINILNVLSELNKAKKNHPYLEIYISKKDISYWDRAKFHTLMMYLLKNSNDIDFDSEEYKDWERITKNIIENFNIDKLEKFQDTLKLISTMSDNIQNLYEYIASEEFLSTDKLNKGHRSLEFQQQEEQLKAKLVVNNPDIDWKEAIDKAEKHPYLNGHISFLIEIAGYQLEKFKDYFERFNELFKKDEEKFLFQRALLSKGDYLVGDMNEWRNRTFCSFNAESQRAKDDNWKQVFHSEFKRLILRDLLEDKRGLQEIIDDFDKTNDWRYSFIKNEAVLKYCSQYQIRMKNENDILVLSKLQTNGKHVEYYTYSLYLQIKDDSSFSFNNINYADPNSIDLPKYICINNDKIKIFYGDFNGSWQYKIEFNDNEPKYYTTKDSLIKDLKVNIIADKEMTNT